MPIPKPKSNESENDYIGRCMEAIGGEYDTQEQPLAICYATYRRENMKSIKSMDKKAMARIKFDSDFKGINLVELDSPCWDDYEQIGTKEIDGRTVPNCVPKKD